MRFQYRITFASGKTGISITRERIYDCLRHFRERFGESAVVAVEERHGDGQWHLSYVPPACAEEAASLYRARIEESLPPGYSDLFKKTHYRFRVERTHIEEDQ